LFLGWGILLKRIDWLTILLAGSTTVLLWITARKEEVENVQFFGEKYQDYMSETKRFIPLIL
jgi:protein-S-isoprenylcysteine O-methyltransferase Ste14